MKVNRHAKIVELINKYQIETQEEQIMAGRNMQFFRRDKMIWAKNISAF